MNNGYNNKKGYDDSLDPLYLNQISRIKPLKLGEELDLAKKIQKGDKAALDRLVKSNLRFVVSVAGRYRHQGMPYDDLVDEGNYGLIKAAKRFSEKRNVKFISYAVWWIRQAILQALAEQSRIVKLPLNKVNELYTINKEVEKLEQKYGREPYPEELARILDIKEKSIESVTRFNKNHISLDSTLDDEDIPMINSISYDEQEMPDEEVDNADLSKSINKVLESLNDKEHETIRKYFGIGEETPQTLDKIGAEFNLSRERIRQIKEKGIKKIKHRKKTMMHLNQYKGD
jgi:RNA polymerase primary sigma factor